MKIRGLLIAALLLAGLSGLVYWSNKTEEANKDKPDPNAPPKIIDVKQDSVTGIEISKPGAKTLVLKKGDDGKWKLTAPEPLSADQSAVTSLLSTIAKLDSNRLIEEKATNLSDFGLDAPKLEVVVHRKDGGDLKLLVGDETPTKTNYFAKLDKDPRVFTMAGWNKTSIDKSPWDLRDKRLLTFDSDKLSRVELTAKGQSVEIGKNNQNEWQIVKPRPLRADGGNVEQLISRLKDAKMDTEPSAKELKQAAATFARAKKVAVVKVTDAAGTQQLEVRKAKSGNYYAKSSVVDGVYKVSSTVGEGLDKGLNDLRNKKLFDFGWNTPNKIEVRDGDKTATYVKSGTDWLRDGKKMDSATVRTFIDELRNLTSTAFPDKGFTKPIFEVTVVSNDGKRTEKVFISKNGSDYFAKRENEPSLYQLKPVDVDSLQQAARDIKEPAKKKDEKSKS